MTMKYRFSAPLFVFAFAYALLGIAPAHALQQMPVAQAVELSTVAEDLVLTPVDAPDLLSGGLQLAQYQEYPASVRPLRKEAVKDAVVLTADETQNSSGPLPASWLLAILGCGALLLRGNSEQAERKLY